MVMFRCPNTGFHTHHWFEEAPADEVEDRDHYQSVHCMACQQVHLVSRGGKVLGASKEQSTIM
jgi:hypothetical protein